MSTPRIYPYPLPDALIAQILDIGRFLQREFPDDWRNAHNGSEPSGSTFVRRWALACRDANIDVGVNGKRGTETLSQDVLTLGVQSGAAQDRGNTVPSMVIADVIAGAGGSNPSVGWNDVSAASPGRYIVPWLEESEQPGPAPGPDPDPGPGPIPPTPIPPTTPPHNDAAFVLINEKLDRVLLALDEAARQQAADHQETGRWMVEQAQGVVTALTNEIAQLKPLIAGAKCRLSLREAGRVADVLPPDAPPVEEADVDPPPAATVKKARVRTSTRTATHKK